MNYVKLYDNLILAARDQQRVKTTRYEYDRHHIIPRSLGGEDIPSNLVLLTPREHYLAHKLLVKIYSGEDRSKMIYALWWMTKTKKIVAGVRITSRDYDRARKMFIEANVNAAPHRKERYLENYYAGKYKFDYEKVSCTLKSTLSKMSDDEMTERMKRSALACDQDARAAAIRRGKASKLQIVGVDGSSIIAYSYEVKELLNLSWQQVKYRVSSHNGILLDGRRVIILDKYTGGNKWKK
jgi:hypothetical protein